jgi:hypothetical protein
VWKKRGGGGGEPRRERRQRTSVDAVVVETELVRVDSGRLRDGSGRNEDELNEKRKGSEAKPM